jgi:hypothetical protein
MPVTVPTPDQLKEIAVKMGLSASLPSPGQARRLHQRSSASPSPTGLTPGDRPSR